MRTVDDVDRLLRAGADKVGVNTAAIARPELIAEVADRFGSQVLVLSADVRRRRRRRGHGDGRLRGHHARRPAGHRDRRRRVGARAAELGAGEILLNSMDADGTKDGFDLELIELVRARGAVSRSSPAAARARSSTSPRRSGPAPTRCWRRASSTSASSTIGEVKDALRQDGIPVR